MARPRLVAFFIHEFRAMIPPTLFFAFGFNLIMFTTQLVLDDYRLRFFNFMVATTGALLVGKAVLVANALPFLRRFDNAPLIQPILFKTLVYVLVVMAARLLEEAISYFIGGGTLAGLVPHALEVFRWHHFLAVQIWITVLFLLYTTASELNALLGAGELWRLIFGRAASDLKGARRQRARTLVKLGRLAAAHTSAELRQPNTAAHGALLDLADGLTRRSVTETTIRQSDRRG